MPIFFYKDSLFGDYIDYIETISSIDPSKEDACEEAILYLRGLLKDHPNMTFEEAANVSLIDDKFRMEWVLWGLMVTGESWSQDLINLFLKKFEGFPERCFRIYIDLEHLDKAADTYLESQFRNKLPRMERELQENIVVRKKESE